MDGLVSLDIVIGLTFVYVVLSLLCVAINEVIATSCRLRAKCLESGLHRILDAGSVDLSSSSITSELYAHPLITTLATGAPNHLPYIPPGRFVAALLDVLRQNECVDRPPGGVIAGTGIRDMESDSITSVLVAAQLPDALRRQLDALTKATDGSDNKIRLALCRWFIENMDQVSAVYRARMRVINFAVATVVALAFGADSVAIVRGLVASSAIRAIVSAEAPLVVASRMPLDGASSLTPVQVGQDKRVDSTFATTVRVVDSLLRPRLLFGILERSRKRLGADPNSGHDASPILSEAAGTLVTILAISFGAPFWFDVLSRFVNIRIAAPPAHPPEA
jgi:hypothetical protein